MRMTCSRSCQDPTPSSEFLQDLVDPSGTIVFQSPLVKDYPPPSPLVAGSEVISPLDVLYSAEQTFSKAGSPSGESFSDCSLSDFGTSTSQESYTTCNMDPNFCPQDELYSARSYPSPGSVSSNPTRWSVPGYYVNPSRQNDGLLTFDPLSTNNQVNVVHPADAYEASNLAMCSSGMPVSSVDSFTYPVVTELQSPSIQTFHNPWQGPEPFPRARSVNPSPVQRNLPYQMPQWTHAQSYDQGDRVAQHQTQSLDIQGSRNSETVMAAHDQVNDTAEGSLVHGQNVPLNQSAPQLVHSQTPKSEHAALTPASGPLPLYRMEPWQSAAQDQVATVGELEQSHSHRSGLTAMNSSFSPAASTHLFMTAAETVAVGKDATSLTGDEILAEANGLEPARKNGPLYNVKPEEDGRYHCPYIETENCNHPPTKLKCNYDKYIDAHIKPHRCKNPECRDLRFSSTACRLRHEREAHGSHGHGVRPYLCEYPECERSKSGNGFPRSWNRNDHMKRVHDHTFSADHEEMVSPSTTKPKPMTSAPISKGGIKRKQPTDLATREEAVKKTKRLEEGKDESAATSLTLQQRVDGVQEQWSRQWREANRQLNALKGPLQIAAAQELQATVAALLASTYQLSDLVGNRSWLVQPQSE